MTMDITALEIRLPPLVLSTSLLGPFIASTYLPLYAKAGSHSRPPTVRKGQAAIPCAPYSAPTFAAEESCEDAACAAVGALLQANPAAVERVQSVLHVQCSLNQQALGSACLRLEHEYFKSSPDVLAIGQLGTAGFPTAVSLLDHGDAEPALGCISVSDKWLAPFYRQIPGVVTYADAAAACLVARSRSGGDEIAVVERVITTCQPGGVDPWLCPADRQLEQLYDLARYCITTLLCDVSASEQQQLRLAGDEYADGIGTRIAHSVGLQALPRSFPPAIHLASVSPIAAISDGIATASRERRPCRLVVWTATVAGHAAALLVRCNPMALQTAGGWSTSTLGAATTRPIIG